MIAKRTLAEHGGTLPCDNATLLSFAGVGPKCANLVLGISCNQPRVAVDVHVHRVTNRWGYVQTRTEGETTAVDVLRPPYQNPVQYVLHCIETGEAIEGPLSLAVSRIGQQIVDSAVLSAKERRTVALVE